MNEEGFISAHQSRQSSFVDAPEYQLSSIGTNQQKKNTPLINFKKPSFLQKLRTKSQSTIKE